MICAIARKLPKKAYLELLAQPDKTVVYTFNDEIVKRTNKSKGISGKCKTGCTGKTNQAVKLKLAENTGLIKNHKEFALEGVIISFKNNFIPSIRNCNKPHKPITLGPLRR